MKITKLEVQKNNKNRVNLFLDEEFACGLSLETVMKNHIKIGQEISEQSLLYLKNETERTIAFAKGANYLAKVQKTEKEVQSYLTKKGFQAEIAEEVVEKLKNYGYIDDKLYAKNFIKYKSNSQGKRKIFFELKNKGINEEIINEKLEEIESEDETITKILQKYLKNKMLDAQTKQKAYRFLLSKGFSGEDTLKVLNKQFKGEE